MCVHHRNEYLCSRSAWCNIERDDDQTYNINDFVYMYLRSACQRPSSAYTLQQLSAEVYVQPLPACAGILAVQRLSTLHALLKTLSSQWQFIYMLVVTSMHVNIYLSLCIMNV